MAKKPTLINNNLVVRFLFSEMHRQGCLKKDLCEKVGINRNTLRNWNVQNVPKINDIEAALNYLGYTLQIKPIGDTNEQNINTE